MLANYKKVPVRNWIIRHYWKKDGVDDEFIFETPFGTPLGRSGP